MEPTGRKNSAARARSPRREHPIAERRRYPRARSGVTLIEPVTARLRDVSPYGARVRMSAPPAIGESVALRLRGTGRPVEGEAVGRVAAHSARGLDGSDVHLRFEQIESGIQQEVLRVAKAQLLCDGLLDTAARVSVGHVGGYRAVRAQEECDVLAAGLVAASATLTVARMVRGRAARAAVVGREPAGARLLVEVTHPGSLGTPGRPVACCAQASHESMLFVARVVGYRAGEGGDGQRTLAVLLLPATFWLTDRRDAGRTSLTAGDEWRFELGGERLPVRDHSAGGLSLYVPDAGPAADLLRPGVPANGHLTRPGRPSRSVVILPRHARVAPGGRVVGVAYADRALVSNPEGRPEARVRRWAAREVQVQETPRAVTAERVRFGPTARRISGLWQEVSPADADRAGDRTLIVVPPAWGRTKESSGLVAQALCATFESRRRHVAILRLDYAETIGESHCSPVGSDAGREALGLTLSGCESDLRAALQYGLERLDAAPEHVVLLGMSFSGPLCLRVAATDPRVTELIQMMGASDIQDLVRTATGGVDYVARYRAGLHSGVENVLGLLCNTDLWCRDGLAARLLLITHAQRDAGRLRTPILWIQGEHDAFVSPSRVRSILDAAGSSSRELAVVPCGHVPSQTREALIGLAPAVERLLGPGPVAVPEPEVLRAALQREWALAPRETLASPADYWRDYMLGETDDALGFDVLTLTREYGEMMTLQAELLALAPGATVHDIGGGMGYSVPFLAAACEPVEVVLYDLVAELLDAAQARWRDLPVQLDTQLWDAEAAPPARLQGADRVLMSLLLTVLRQPARFLARVVAALPVGAVVVASSIRPDADLSLVYARLLADVTTGRIQPPPGVDRDGLVSAIRDYMCSAAHLLRLAEEGTFHLYEPAELSALLEDAGLTVDTVRPCFGTPARAVVVRATKLR